MFTILEGINRFLGFLNIKSKIKNRMYIIISIFTTGYIGYLTIKFFKFHAYKRAIVYLLIFLVLVYFLLLNIIYYFTEKTVKWDITPYMSKVVVDDEATEVDGKNTQSARKKAEKVGGKLLVYDDQGRTATSQLLDATVVIEDEKKSEIEDMVQFMIDHQLVKADYGGKKERQMKEKTYAIAEEIEIPSSSLTEEEGQLELSIGFNATDRVPIGKVTQIENMPVAKMLETYTIQPISATITGGKFKLPGRSGTMPGKDNYEVHLQVALEVKE